MYLHSATVSARGDVRFEDNAASATGGGLMVTLGSHASLYAGVKVEGNRAWAGAGVRVSGSSRYSSRSSLLALQVLDGHLSLKLSDTRVYELQVCGTHACDVHLRFAKSSNIRGW